MHVFVFQKMIILQKISSQECRIMNGAADYYWIFPDNEYLNSYKYDYAISHNDIGQASIVVILRTNGTVVLTEGINPWDMRDSWDWEKDI